MEKIQEKLVSTLSGQDFLVPARFMMTTHSLDMLSNNLNPQSEDDKILLKSQIENMFKKVAECDDKRLILSKTGDWKNNCEYFDSVLEEMKNKYPMVGIQELFNLQFTMTGDKDKDLETINIALEEVQTACPTIDVKGFFNTIKNSIAAN